MNTLHIRRVSADDADSLCAIYNYYIANTAITLDTEPYAAGEWDKLIAGAEGPFLCATRGDKVVGFCFAKAFRLGRCGYRFTSEISIYVAPDETGRGVGKTLMAALLRQLRGARQVLALISLPNDASVGLHERFGFVHRGTMRQVGRKFDQWVDVGIWQASLPAADERDEREP